MIERARAVDIRRYRPEDREGLIGLVLPIQRDEFGVAITAEEQPDFDVPGFFRGGASGFWIASDGERVLGSVGLLDIGDGVAVLRKMFVHADYRGKQHGLAQRLLDTVFDAARASGVAEVLLSTHERFLAAHRFYEKNGFTPLEADELPARFPRMRQDNRFYRRRLADRA
jgi:N-acetylglutamate synthase-like GNAT family acetyltransferase